MVEIVWEFSVHEGRELEFEQAYRSDGIWAVLFRKSPEYHGTRLLRDRSRRGRYLTIDTWASEEAFKEFKQSFGDEYAEIDAKCEALTTSERLVGVFSAT